MLSDPKDSPDLESLDREITALDITLVAVHKRLHRRLADSRKRRNTLAPISKLPMELMITTFLDVLEDVTIKKYYPSVKALSQVCSAWYSIIQSTANFWARIHSDFSLPAIGKILHKSRNAPLTVECGYLLLSTEAKAFVDMLIPSAKRIRSLTVGRDFAGSSGATKLLGPKLEHLVYRTPNVTLPLALGNWAGPLDGLREVVLESAYLPWSSVSLKGLKTLKLVHILSQGPSLQQLLEMMAESPSLRDLTLNHISIHPGPSFETASTITLPSLQRLQLVHISQTTTLKILNSIRAPHCLDTRVACCFDYATSDSLPILISLAQTIPRIQTALDDGYQLCINVTSRLFHCWTESEGYGDTLEPNIDIEMEGIPPYKALSWLLNLLKPPPDRRATLTVGPDFNVSEPSFVRAVNHKLRFVTRLHLTTDLSVDPLLKQLGRQVSQSAGTTWPMPRLSSLNLGTAYFSGLTLVDTLKTRYSRKKGVGKKGKGRSSKTAPKPEPLTSLVVVGRQSMDEEVQDEVEDILGPGVLDWDMDDEDYDDDYSYDDDIDYWDDPYYSDHLFGDWD